MGGALRPVRWLTVLCLCAATACGSAAPAPARAHHARDRILAAVDTLDSAAPLRLRYNPAPCACPAFEVHLGGRWVRASWPAVRHPPWTELAERLAATSAPQWPVLLRVVGRIDREVHRTRAGGYAVSIEVAELLTP